MRLLTVLLVTSGCLSPVASATVSLLQETHSGKADAWGAADLVEVRRIIGTAVSSVRDIAFIIEVPSIADNTTRYELYYKSADGPKPSLIIRCRFITELRARPQSKQFTFLADFGEGVQLYSFDDVIGIAPLVRVDHTVRSGGYHGAIVSPSQPERPTGVLSYGWNPSGSRLWYSSLSEEDERSHADGYRYSAETMSPYSLEHVARFRGLELWVKDPNKGSRTAITRVETDPLNAQSLFKPWSVKWNSDTAFTYRVWDTRLVPATLSNVTVDVADPDRVTSRMEKTDVRRSSARSATARSVERKARNMNSPVAEDRNRELGSTEYIATEPLVKLRNGSVIFTTISERSRGIAVEGRSGLQSIAPTLDNRECSAGGNQPTVICSAEGINSPPMLISIDWRTHRVGVIFDPNAGLRSKPALKWVWRRWRNIYDEVSGGFVIYPRHFKVGKRYPLLIVSHARDAKLTFADPAFQWQYPLQVFAERGYVVIGFNEAISSDEDHSAIVGLKRSSPSALQRSEIMSPVASAEAAVRWAINSGIADPNRVGIAGYSRGGIIALLAMTQSSLFCVASVGDTNFFNPGAYWLDGSTAAYYDRIFGGPPFDERYEGAYKNFSPSYRTAQFAGPLLQQFAGASGTGALEMHTLLRRRGLPVDTWIYPGETHLFHQPRSRLSAMELNLKWFEYWLGGAAGKSHQTSWNNLAQGWATSSSEMRPREGDGDAPSKACLRKLL